MAIHQTKLLVRTNGPGPCEITSEIQRELDGSGLTTGTVTIFCQHTSCSLMIMENADPSAWQDLQVWLDRLVPENDPAFRHRAEGPDDMPSHIKMALTRTNEVVPFADRRLLLGTWQGIYLCEFDGPRRRQVHVQTVGS